MRLKLGTLTSIIVSSPEIAKIVLQQRDQVFCSRTIPEAARALDHHKFSVGWTAPLDNQWRILRKLCKEKIFSVQKLDASQGLRREKLQNLLDYVNECSINSQAVDIGRAAFTTSLNLMSTTLFSIDFATLGSDSSHEFRDIVTGLMTIGGKPNLADFYPVFRKFDPQGIVRKTTVYMRKLFGIFDEIINERINNRGANMESYQPKNDLLEEFLDVNLKNESELSFDDIKHLAMDLFVASSDTTSGTVEWAMVELIRNPDKLSRTRDELRNFTRKNGTIQESDISHLPYLQAVVKETFRLHPAAPFLIPHKAKTDIEISGYMIPKNAQILINVWAIGRDSRVWKNADSFMPERFLDHNDTQIDFRGKDFELIPFGAGRRICPGLSLANRMVHLMLATLVQNFGWELEVEEELDMDEKFGLTVQKAIPLKVVPTKL